MPIKLGEMLVKAGMISPASLDDALKSQVIFGGKLGTNLIEMGYIDEVELARMLSDKLKVPFADPEELMLVPPEVTALIPLEIVEKYKVVPLRLDNRRLSLVMADPSDLAAVDEISFLTGLIIRPMVAPELRLYMAMEKYYGIKRELRYLPVSKALGGRRGKPKTEQFVEFETDAVDFSTIPGGEESYDFELVEEAERAARVEAVHRYTIDYLSQELAEAKDRDDIATAVVSYISQELDRAAIFLVRKDGAAGWVAVSQGKKIDGFDAFRADFPEVSALHAAADKKGIYLGPLQPSPANLRMLDALGGGSPPAVLLIPVVMMGRVVAILYTEGEADTLNTLLPDLRKLAGKTSMAFEVLILKSKIIMT